MNSKKYNSFFDIFFVNNQLSIPRFLDVCRKSILKDNLLWSNVLYSNQSAKIIFRYLEDTLVKNNKIAFAPATFAVEKIIQYIGLCCSDIKYNYYIFDKNIDKIFPYKIYSHEMVKQFEIEKIVILSGEYGDEIEHDYIKLGIQESKIVNIYKKFLQDFLIACDHYAEKYYQKLNDSMLLLCCENEGILTDERLKYFISYWMLEVFTETFIDKTDISYFINMTIIKSDQGDFKEASVQYHNLVDFMHEHKVNTLNETFFMLTYRCNLRCKHCSYYTHGLFSPVDNELSCEQIVQLFKKSEILNNSNNHIFLSGGELFVRKDIRQILAGLASLGIKFSLCTNGTFPDKLHDILLDNSIRKSIRTIQLSYDGTKLIHDKIRCQGAYEKLIKSIEILKYFNIETQLNSVIQKDNIDILPDMIKEIDSIGCFHSFSLEMQHTKFLEVDNLINIKDYLTGRANISNTFLRIINSNQYTGIGCLSGITICIITPSGDVGTCETSRVYNHQYIFGNLSDCDMNFDQLWFSETSKEIRLIKEQCPGCSSPCDRGRFSF